VADLVSECAEYDLVAFAENWDRARGGQALLGQPIYWVQDLPSLAATHKVVRAIGTTRRFGFVQ
jgi:hypothetical protein